MATEHQVREAMGILRKYSQTSSRRHSRAHSETLDENRHRLRALEGLCGECPNLNVEFQLGYIGRITKIRCAAGLSPLNLYKNTDLGVFPLCPAKPK